MQGTSAQPLTISPSPFSPSLEEAGIHWGVKTVSGVCSLCRLPLTSKVSDRSPGLVSFFCGEFLVFCHLVMHLMMLCCVAGIQATPSTGTVSQSWRVFSASSRAQSTHHLNLPLPPNPSPPPLVCVCALSSCFLFMKIILKCVVPCPAPFGQRLQAFRMLASCG